MDGPGNSARRWTCQACGCNTNQSSDQTCSVCGTSDGASLLRRSGYAARAGLFARSIVARRAYAEEEHIFDDDNILDRVDDVDMAGDDEDEVVTALAMEVAGVPSVGRIQEGRRQRLLEAARTFGIMSSESQRVNPEDLLRAATENAGSYQPKWAAAPQGGGARARAGNGIVIGEGDRQSVAHLPQGAGEGKALRAAEPLPRGTAFSSFTLSPTANQSTMDRRQRRVIGFRVAFDHPRREQGRSMGGCYLVGVTIAAFNAYGERNGLQQSPFFWGIEDGGSKFEGSRHAASRGTRRGPSHYAVEILPHEAPRNTDNVLFGCRDVVSVVVDFDARSLTFWRNETLLGNLVSNLPRGGQIFPVVVPFNAGVTVAISGMNADPIPLLQTFASDWRQAQKEKDDSRRQKLAEQRAFLIQNGRPSDQLVAVLKKIFASYATAADEIDQVCPSLSAMAAARLWYRCGMKLSHFDSLKKKISVSSPFSSFVDFEDFLEPIARIVEEEEISLTKCNVESSGRSDGCKVGDKVELAEGYERFGDASNGPLQPGSRGTVVEVQQGPNGERQSVRVIFNGRRWWYQPQALISDSSGLTESPAVWFLRTILRAHSYDHTSLQPLWGKPLTSSSWQVGDIVAPRLSTSTLFPDIHENFGRIVIETSSSSSPISTRSRDSVLVEFVDESFGETTGVLSAESIANSPTLYTRRVRLNRLVHARCRYAADLNGRDHPDSNCDTEHHTAPPMDYSHVGDHQHVLAAVISSKLKNLLNGLGELDVQSIEELNAECRRNVATLASSLLGGLLEMYLKAFDRCNKLMAENKENRNAALAITALGDLSICIANQIYDSDGSRRHGASYTMPERISQEPCAHSDEHESQRYHGAFIPQPRRDEPVIRDMASSTSHASTNPETLPDFNVSGSVSSIQRHSMLLALMSRSRRGNPGSVIGLEVEMGSTFAFTGQGGLHLERNWFDSQPRVNGNPSTTRLMEGRNNFANEASLSFATAMSASNCNIPSSTTVLDAVVRGQGGVSSGSRSNAAKVSPTSMMRSLITNGLLNGSLKWVQATTTAQSERSAVGSSMKEKFNFLREAVDDDGTPLLLLAISLGCSEPIIRFLIAHGAPVTENELRAAAMTDQPRIVSILLDHFIYTPGMIDQQVCSVAVAKVLEAAAAGQSDQESKMRNHADEFLPVVINRLCQLGLSSRRLQTQCAQSCGKSATVALVGNVLIDAFQDHQSRTSSIIPSRAMEATGTNQSMLCGRFPVAVRSQVCGTSSGLLAAVPFDIIRKALLRPSENDVPPLLTYMLLAEDCLYSRSIDNAGVGLTLLCTILTHFPSFTANSFMDRFGFSELVSFHESTAATSLAQISSRLASSRGGNRSDCSRQTMLVSDGTVYDTACAILCPRHHPATLHITRHSSFRCDLCGKAVERGRQMHGCRECDWDACEQCTDNSEGGIVKWSRIRDLALECQQLLAVDEDDLLNESYDRARSSAVDYFGKKDNDAELNNLSARLLQRAPDSLQQLADLLETCGSITTHQFVTIILPSLHCSLFGRSDIGRPEGFGPRCKKARVVVFSGRHSEESYAALSEGNRQFGKLAVECLIAKPTTESKASYERQNSEADWQGEYDNEDDDDSDDETKERRLSDRNSSKEWMPEVVRRLHKVLSFYETNSVVRGVFASNQRSGQGGLGADLQALTQPVDLVLFPSVFGRHFSAEKMRPLAVSVEPLITMFSLEKLILCTFRNLDPSYIYFCQRLAADKAVIAERPRFLSPCSRSCETVWRLGIVESYDEEIGSHRICYASGLLQDSDIGGYNAELRVESIASHLAFNGPWTSIILAAREFVVLHRQVNASNKVGDEGIVATAGLNSNDSEFDCILLGNPDSPLASYIGARVESTTGSEDAWRPYTILSVKNLSPVDLVLSANPHFTLASDDGVVLYDVPLIKVRGFDAALTDRPSPLAVREGIERAFGGNAGFENRSTLSRAFPFMSGRRESIDARRPSLGSETLRAGVLKRTWSALSPVESMNPRELNLCVDEQRWESHMGKWRCSIGGRTAHVIAERGEVEFPPTLRVFFSTSDILPTSELPSETTLIAALKQLSNRDERTKDPIFLGQPQRLFISIKAVPRQSGQRASPAQSFEPLLGPPVFGETFTSSVISTKNSTPFFSEESELESSSSWSLPNRSRKLSLSNIRVDEDYQQNEGLCDGLDETCVQCMDVLSVLAEFAENNGYKEGPAHFKTVFESPELTRKLIEQLEDPLIVVGGALPEWCTAAASYAPRVFTYESRRLLVELAAFGVSRSAFRQQEAKVNVGPLRKRMAALRGRAVELVGEAFSGGAEDPTALQLQADELYGMEEALAARVKAAFRAQRWEERALQVAKAAVRREALLLDAAAVMAAYAEDSSVRRRRMEVRFDGESGFDAASGDEAGVTRGFYADVAEALLSCDHVSGAFCNNACASRPVKHDLSERNSGVFIESSKLPLWIPDMDASGHVVIPTPRADSHSGLGVFPRPLAASHPQFKDVLVQFRFIGRLFAAAMRDGFMFPIPLSAAFLKLVQSMGRPTHSMPVNAVSRGIQSNEPSCMRVHYGISADEPEECTTVCFRDILLSSADLPRPGFLGGEIFAVELHVCRVLDEIDDQDPPLIRSEVEKRYRAVASDQQFARIALGKSYDCSFEDYFQDRTFVDPLDPSQGENAAPLCPKGHAIPVTIYNVREWVSLAKQFVLHDGVVPQAQAFHDGVEDFFPPEFLRVFTPDELQRDVCGVGDNVETWDENSIRKLFKLDGGKDAAEALVAVASIGGEGGVALSRRFGPSSPTVTYLVKALLEATQRQRRQFLSFVTSVPIVTPGLIEIVPVVAPTGEFLPMRDPGCLPRANTCARRLYLPRFESFESFADVLWAVVREESKFKGFYEWRG